MSLKYKVNINHVGLESADKAYGGFLDAYSFKDTHFNIWFEEYKKLILSKMGKEYFPIYRMADGEYRFLMGRKYNFYKKPLWKELIAVTAEKLRIKNPDKWKTSWGEEYAPEKVKQLRQDLIENIKYISQKGQLACYFNENGLNAFVEYNKYLTSFFAKHNITFNSSNYIPFHFVCGLLVRPGWEAFYKNRTILVVTGSDDNSEPKIKNTLLKLGVNEVLFLRISKKASMEEIINLDTLNKPIDLCLVAAGIGSAHILKQLEPLNTVVLDIGGYINCYIDNNSSQHGGIFKLPH
ncbi:hypothetical protein [Pseudotamlana carrageenivorans]|uniref:Glycosyltransferase GT-D fold domain-containing protein n=1 Tax=Pseudotamlana carrageenivorans TaxID=2069432 RepID=A0A2I7SIX6_9FLAO|nr:hypothetical protein [Tamlana carrageenivorans]AUS05839.1 hypothetical protein C1A40_10365 [Tamlana carrageenivorans]